MISISEILLNARKSKGLILRKVASEVDIDQSLISKFEKGERQPTLEQIEKLSEFYNIPKHQLIVDIISEKVYKQIKDLDFATEILKVAEEKVTYNRYDKNT
jgi:transcriptional regulator with XRE-family HTH domain